MVQYHHLDICLAGHAGHVGGRGVCFCYVAEDVVGVAGRRLRFRALVHQCERRGIPDLTDEHVRAAR